MFSLILSRKALSPVFFTQICNTSKNVKKLMNEKLIDVVRNIVGLSFPCGRNVNVFGQMG